MVGVEPMVRVDIIGSGRYLGEKIVDNTELVGMMYAAGYDPADEKNKDITLTPEWLGEVTGIQQRRFANPSGFGNTTRLATNAAREALGDIDPSTIDLVILGTTTSDQVTPASVFAIQEELGMVNALPGDFANACNSFTSGLLLATATLGSLGFKKAMVIGAENLSRIVDFRDFQTAGIFSDAAGAVVIERNDESSSGLLALEKGADPAARRQLTCAHPSDTRVLDESAKIEMAGRGVANTILRLVPDLVPLVLKKAGWTIDDVDHVVIHQSSGRVIDKFEKKTGIPPEKIRRNVDILGNSSAATVAVTLDILEKSGDLRKDDNLLIVSAGIGASAIVGAWRR